jgi:hypothetical protein
MLRPPHLKMKFAFPVLLWFRVIVMMRFLFRVLCFVLPSVLVPLFALTQAHKLLAVADALFGMVNINLLILLQIPFLIHSHITG